MKIETALVVVLDAIVPRGRPWLGDWRMEPDLVAALAALRARCGLAMVLSSREPAFARAVFEPVGTVVVGGYGGRGLIPGTEAELDRFLRRAGGFARLVDDRCREAGVDCEAKDVLRTIPLPRNRRRRRAADALAGDLAAIARDRRVPARRINHLEWRFNEGDPAEALERTVRKAGPQRLIVVANPDQPTVRGARRALGDLKPICVGIGRPDSVSNGRIVARDHTLLSAVLTELAEGPELDIPPRHREAQQPGSEERRSRNEERTQGERT